METLLDHHLKTFDGWLQKYLKSLSPESHFLAAVTLLAQFDPEAHNWNWVNWLSLILRTPSSIFPLALDILVKDIEFTRIVAKFLMNPDRAGSFWVNSRSYADLARYILEFLRHK